VSELTCRSRLLLLFLGVLGATGQVHSESHGPLLDPTRPQGWQVSAQDTQQPEDRAVVELQLQGTFSRAGERSAMISGKRVGVGDEVSGAEVIEINRNSVLLRVDGETVELASMLPGVKSLTGLGGSRK